MLVIAQHIDIPLEQLKEKGLEAAKRFRLWLEEQKSKELNERVKFKDIAEDLAGRKLGDGTFSQKKGGHM